jgi:hypothetical protein
MLVTPATGGLRRGSPDRKCQRRTALHPMGVNSLCGSGGWPVGGGGGGHRGEPGMESSAPIAPTLALSIPTQQP